MDPLSLIGLILGGGGGAVSALSSIFGGREQQPVNINQAQTEQFIQLLNNLLGGQQEQLAAQTAQAQRVQTQVGDVAQQQRQLSQQIADLPQPGETDWLDTFLTEMVPAFTRVAEEAAQVAVGDQEAGRERAQRASEQAVTTALDQFAGGGAFSGAAAQAATQAAIDPQLAYLQQLDQMFGQQFGQTFGQLAGTGQQLSFQGQQNQFLNQLGQLQAALGGTQAQAGTLGQQLGGALSQAQLAQQGLQSTLGQLGQISQPVYSMPSYVQGPGVGIGQTIAGIGGLLGQFGQQRSIQDLIEALGG